jgi:hypothetical protein
MVMDGTAIHGVQVVSVPVLILVHLELLILILTHLLQTIGHVAVAPMRVKLAGHFLVMEVK